MPSRLLPLAGVLLLTVLAVACANKAVAPADFTPQAGTENAYIVTEDGVVLNGRLFGAANDSVVILTHMRANDQTAWCEFAQVLEHEGYAALTFNFRGYGDSQGSKDASKLDEDLAGAIRYMHDRGKKHVYLVGASMGATTSLVVAARDDVQTEQDDVQAVVAISPPARFEDQDALAAAPNVRQPKLLIASEGDKAALAFDDLVAATAAPKEVESYTGNAHGTDLFKSEHAAALQNRILSFLREQGGP
jgi:pimeloyl-ACP methyl ester carboxylesterase